MRSAIATVTWLVLALSAPEITRAGEWDLTGFAEIANRAFGDDGRFADQHAGASTSLAIQSEIYWQGSGDRARFSAVGFGRLDSEDDERSHLDLRELNFGVVGDGWDLNLGVNKVFWGVTESRHLIDVINQTDLVEDIDEEDKLGQPMVNLSVSRDFGRLDLYVLPRFRERTFPGRDGRLRSAIPVDTDAAIFESRDGKRHTDVSLRYSHYFGPFDVGAYVFDGTSREPRFELAGSGDRLLPVYEQMQQVGIDVQLTRDAWLWKLEAITRAAASDSFAAAVTGIEYTFFGVTERGADIGFLFEYLYDGRDAGAPPTVFDDDVFLGTRLALNDVGDTSVLAGAVIDADSHAAFINIEASRRFGNRLTLAARLRAFGNVPDDDAAYALEADDYLEIAFGWYY